ncbi:MAG: efflux RND transporter periplasmic adaptor subunit [Peptococcaceae bacterium]|nr:efflux RND transporter periplasmic adaptor subunit [Peptococcaceae bacterium]
MARGKLLVLVLAGLLLLTVAGCGAKQETASKVEDKGVAVAVAEVKEGRLSEGDILTGRIAPRDDLYLVPKMPGKVAEVTVDVGDKVHKGQVLVRLEADELKAAVEMAESQLLQAELNFQDASRNYERMKFLLERQAVSQSEFEQAEKAYLLAKDNYERLAPAQLAQARTNYQNSIIKAPINGLVAACDVEPGEMASTAQPALRIVNMDEVTVEVGVSEQLVNRIRPGQKVQVTVAAAGAEPFSGTVASVSPAADPLSKAYPVKITISNPEHKIKPGMFAEVDFGFQDNKALLVPRDAVVTRDGRTAVFVAEKGKARLVPVVTGASDGRNVAIKEGLSEGDRVIVAGQDKLEDGTKIEVVRVED